MCFDYVDSSVGLCAGERDADRLLYIQQHQPDIYTPRQVRLYIFILLMSDSSVLTQQIRVSCTHSDDGEQTGAKVMAVNKTITVWRPVVGP